MENKVFKPIEVISYFQNLEMKIVRFRKDNTVYKVSEIISKWKVNEGERIITHFTLLCKEQNIVCELAFCHNDLKWEFIQYENLD